ncbi:MAG: HAD-IC family P-type ATPase [Candidatus Kerfeldbacteria bacterium]|nr:HAD-IC family P-type ATPase [Candidatus Kerfeldbacteria bacterium]
MEQPPLTIPWHAQNIEEVLRQLRTTIRGLTSTEAAERQRSAGRNVITVRRRRSDARLFISQFASPLVLILFGAAAISFFFEALTDAFIIIGVLVFNAVVGFMQERKADEAMNRLRSLSPQLVLVLRDGEERQLPAEELVAGDVVRLEVGSVVPADGRLVEAINLKINEAVFTGESVPAEKHTDPLGSSTSLPDRRNLAWRGTTVASGRGRLAVTDIGTATRFGQIVQAVAAAEEDATPFQRKIADFAKRLAAVIVVLSVVILGLSVARSFSFEDSLLLSVSLVVSLIPEGLPVVITLAFAWGMWQMAKRRALIRKLYAVETLGSVTIIASDKTGTLTFGEMMVEEIITDHRRVRVTGEGYGRHGDFFEGEQQISLVEDTVLRRLVEVGVLNNDSQLSHDEHGQERWLGDPTEISLTVLGYKVSLTRDELERAFPRVGEFPFDFSLKYMVTFHTAANQRYLVAVKGAPRQILDRCTRKLTPDGVEPFTAADRQEARAAFEELATRSLRGLAFAYAETDADWRSITHQNLGQHLVYLGLVGIRDQVRPEARDTVEAARAAGIRVIMLTGDYRVTAVAVAREIGILAAGHDDRAVLDGRDLDRLSDRELSQRLSQAVVFSRVSPEQKLRIARLLKRGGQIVAMTGDGINDVPALTEANIGVAIGTTSTDAAKEAAEMVVTDGNLSSILAAVEEGRVIFRNIQRVLIYLLASNLGELVLILSALFIGLPLPLLPIHIIWLNVVTDPFMGLALAREPKGPHVMAERPRDPAAAILGTGHWARIALNGSVVGLSSLAVLLVATAAGRSTPELFGLTLTTMALGEWFVALNSRSGRRSLLTQLTNNRLILVALALVIGMQLAILYVPALAAAFHLESLRAIDWLWVTLAAGSVIVVEEIRKLVVRQRHRRSSP